MAFRPLGDRVLVRRVEEEEKTKGGIIIPDTAKEKPQEGKVIAVGPGARDDSRQDPAAGREGRRPHPVRQMVRQRSQARWRRSPDHEGERHPGRAGPSKRQDGLAVPQQPHQRKRARTNGCQRRLFLHRRARPHAARRQHPRQRRQGDPGPQGPQRRPRKVVRRAALDQGRRHRRQGNRAGRQVREPRRPADPRSRLQDQRQGRRWHHHRHGPGPGHRRRRPEVGRRRHEPDGPEARRRQGRVARSSTHIKATSKKVTTNQEIAQVGAISRQRRQRNRRHDRQGDGKGRQRRRDHGRRSQEPRDRARSRRRHAVRPRLPRRPTSSPTPTRWRPCSKIR